MNKKKLTALSILIALQIFVIASMFIKSAVVKNYAAKNQTIIRIRCSAYDPFNALKGRYVQLDLNFDDIKEAEIKTGIKLNHIRKTADAYYLQEDYALAIDAMKQSDFNALEPVIELYVGKDGTVIQKELYVHHNGAELTIEEYIKNYAL